ncbi:MULTISPECIES: 16S rRNA (guanine(966)-N(2))-methyltransferase RsmD [unclassified Rhizobium]|uniref:16S rRNA (guanine(966)-N(2))-methyltransferase RsmD n=1 Tax=Rhizobium/Agrobacterium group TaxID=227290 RepID=UPI000DDFE28E|nr:16S rRNA (guanine(966)-N(2))-methyltransferase RsmD [uncultured Rhizobium sp.]MBP2463575.1 16S rRNA (guanine966-N2)-methyltransferase [Rhizobium sp. PvP014]MBP2530970.1 16S rRNA (guanine966-N2)-methyltransferase [Rhizobium sp. PvP099]NSY16358.1 16S rRNA (guanine(966)-N(2))-methyltransferase RsmD [Neorhizobium sp. AL 9.2.2]RZJ96252.1 MAG: 16S rRNA (guanine(966)-N(2))-methyltransferase RsmD [Novosphingobium sp.]
MRIVGGEFRGRTLATPKTSAIRPTIDRTRESLFNIIGHVYPQALDGTRVIDLFAGTGAVGLEAVSRGCRHALFVENGVEGRGLLWENIDAFGLHGRARILRRDATKLGPVGTLEPYNFLFADPPYGQKLGEGALFAAHVGGWLVPGALAILEERADVTVEVDPAYKLLESRTFGDTRMDFFRYEPA